MLSSIMGYMLTVYLDDEKKTQVVLYHDESIYKSMRVKRGCGRRKTNQHFFLKQTGVASWCRTL